MYGVSYPIELNGAFWVWIFLIISGYLASKGFIKGKYPVSWEGYFQFLFNRGLRILPLSLIALVLGCLFLFFDGRKLPETAFLQFFFIPPKNDMSLCGPL